jgi:hypothetical protein
MRSLLEPGESRLEPDRRAFESLAAREMFRVVTQVATHARPKIITKNQNRRANIPVPGAHCPTCLEPLERNIARRIETRNIKKRKVRSQGELQMSSRLLYFRGHRPLEMESRANDGNQ